MSAANFEAKLDAFRSISTNKSAFAVKPNQPWSNSTEELCEKLDALVEGIAALLEASVGSDGGDDGTPGIEVPETLAETLSGVMEEVVSVKENQLIPLGTFCYS